MPTVTSEELEGSVTTASHRDPLLGLHPYALIYWLVGGILTLALIYAYRIDSIASWRGSSNLHTGMEAIATLLALIIGTMALVRFYSRKDLVFLFVGVGFLGTASLDFFHALITSAYFEELTPSDLSSLAPWSWVASRLFLSIFMLLCCFTSRTEVSYENRRITEKFVYLGTALFTFACFGIIALVPLPAAYNPDIFFHRPAEFIPAVIFLVSLILLLRNGHWKLFYFEHWLVLSLIVAFISQAVFMSHSAQLFDYSFDLAHLLKKAGYICVLTGLLISMYMTFKTEEKNSFRAVSQANMALEAELAMRSRIEARLVKREKELLRSNQELEQFAYIASHDLQEPLRKIQSFGDRLQSHYAEALDERGCDYLQRMRSAAGRMSTLINDLLAFSRIKANTGNHSHVDLNEVLKGVLSDLDWQIEEARALVNSQSLPSLQADGIQMRQLLQNLIGNSIKYRSPDRLPQIDIDCLNEPGYCVIRVKDNGIGFEPQYAQQIFEVFQRLHSRNEYDGTGVGLSVVRRIAEAHGGTAEASSIPGEGSVFIVKLKLKT